MQSYDPREEKINAMSHTLGAALAVIVNVLLLIRGSDLPRGQYD